MRFAHRTLSGLVFIAILLPGRIVVAQEVLQEIVVTAQKPVANERANRLAMRTRCLLESFRNRGPFLLVAVKPALLAHVRPMPHENR